MRNYQGGVQLLLLPLSRLISSQAGVHSLRGKRLWGSYSVPFLHIWAQGAGQCWRVWFYMYMGGVPVAVTVANRKGRSSQAVVTLKLQLTDAGVCVLRLCVCVLQLLSSLASGGCPRRVPLAHHARVSKLGSCRGVPFRNFTNGVCIWLCICCNSCSGGCPALSQRPPLGAARTS